MTGRYLLFGSECFYASGGWNDYLGSYASLAEAEEAGVKWASRVSDMDAQAEDGPETYINEPWWHVVDIETAKRIAHSANTPLGHSRTAMLPDGSIRQD